MKMNVAIPTIKCFDLCEEAVRRYRASPLIDKIVVLDNSVGSCPTFPGTTHIVPASNLGCSASWNFFFQQFEEPLIIANDDVLIHEGALDALLNAYRNHPEHGLFYGSVDPANMFSFFLLRHSTYMLVGPFDEQFWPAYFEDCDYGERMARMGVTTLEVAGCTYEHIGSATKKRNTQEEEDTHWRTFQLNKGRFIRKWGGEPGKARYKKAYGP